MEWLPAELLRNGVRAGDVYGSPVRSERMAYSREDSVAAWARAVERVNHNWATSVRSSINWLMQVMGASDETPPNALGNDTG